MTMYPSPSCSTKLKILTMFGCSTSARNRRSARAATVVVRVVGVDQALEHDPPIGHVAVAGQVDPTHPAMGQATGDLVLTGNEIIGRQRRLERERLAALAAEAGRTPRSSVVAATHRLAAGRTEAPLLRHERVRHDSVGGIARGNVRDLDESGTEARARAPDAASRRLASRRWRGCAAGCSIGEVGSHVTAHTRPWEEQGSCRA